MQPPIETSHGSGHVACESDALHGAAGRAAVEAFHDAAVAQGAELLHTPKQWPEDHAGDGGFARDPDGDSVEAVCHR